MPLELGNPIARCASCGYVVSPYTDEFKEKWVWVADPADEVDGGRFTCWGCLSPSQGAELTAQTRHDLAALREIRGRGA